MTRVTRVTRVNYPRVPHLHNAHCIRLYVIPLMYCESIIIINRYPYIDCIPVYITYTDGGCNDGGRRG